MLKPNTYNRSADRTYSGLAPALYDKIDVTYEDALFKETYTYSLLNPHSGLYIVQAIIEVIYTDLTKDRITTVTKTFNAEEF